MDLKKFLEEKGFKKIDFKSTDVVYKNVENYSAKIVPSGELGDREYVLTISFFKDCYIFSISDKIGIIRLISLSKFTPIDVIEAYINRAYDFFSL